MGTTNSIHKNININNLSFNFDQGQTYLDPKAVKTIKFKYDNLSINYSINDYDTKEQIRSKLLKLFHQLEEIVQKAIQKSDNPHPEYIHADYILLIHFNIEYGPGIRIQSLKSTIDHLNMLKLLLQYQKFPIKPPFDQLNYAIAPSISEIDQIDKYFPGLKLKLTFDNLIDLLKRIKLINFNRIFQVKIQQNDDVIITFENLPVDKILDKMANLKLIDINDINLHDPYDLPPYQEKDQLCLS